MGKVLNLRGREGPRSVHPLHKLPPSEWNAQILASSSIYGTTFYFLWRLYFELLKTSCPQGEEKYLFCNRFAVFPPTRKLPYKKKTKKKDKVLLTNCIDRVYEYILFIKKIQTPLCLLFMSNITYVVVLVGRIYSTFSEISKSMTLKREPPLLRTPFVWFSGRILKSLFS